MALAAEFDRKIVVEAAVPAAREIECSVIGNDRPEASVPGEIVPSREFYDYEAKYLEESEALIPAPLDAATTAEVRRLAVEAFLAVDAADSRASTSCSRARRGGSTSTRSTPSPGSPRSACSRSCGRRRGLGYPAVLDRLVELAFERHAGKQSLRTSYP